MSPLRVALLAVLGVLSLAVPAGPVPPPDAWEWPLSPTRVVRDWAAPPEPWSAGHRGIDLAVEPDDVLRAPADGVVAFSGTVVDRVVVTIDHGGGWVSTLEPVREPPAIGTIVRAGDAIAFVGTGGHTTPDAVHFGVRLDGEYINPLLLLDVVPRARLLPCCGP